MPFIGHTKPAELSPAISTYLCSVSRIEKSQQPNGDSSVALPDHEPDVFYEPNIVSHDNGQFGDKGVERIQWLCVASAQGGWDDILEERGSNDSSDCAVASASSSGSLAQLNDSKHTTNSGRLSARVSQNGCPKKAFCGPSLLSQMFEGEKNTRGPRSETTVRPPPGFEPLGIREVTKDGQQQIKPDPTRDEYTPAPELEYLRLIGQLGYREPLPVDLEPLLREVLAAQAAKATRSLDIMGTRQSARKKLKMESKIDCVDVPYKSTSYEEPDD
ncbi:hypothetical protein DL770_000606 [Monosporascus sp. CRB-9-2]|nr:hypothetical protein DL770_000606 [Monosporascus sp. CRB-9-2]